MPTSLANLTIENSFNEKSTPEFTPEMIAIVIADKKHRRAKKQLTFNCIMLDRDPPSKEDELVSFLKKLELQKSNFLLNHLRFQVIYQSININTHTKHWSVLDVLIKDKQLNFFLLDAAHTLPHILLTLATIQLHCPEATIQYASGSLQNDHINCATYALDHACRLAKIPLLHETLATIKEQISLDDQQHYIAHMLDSSKEMIRVNYIPENEIKKLPTLFRSKNFSYIPIQAFPAEFGPLLRNMQSLSRLKTLFFSKHMKGNDNDDLETYVTKRLVSKTKTQNFSIEHKRLHIKTKADAYISEFKESGLFESLEELIEQQKDYNKIISRYKKEKTNSFVIRHWQKETPTEALGLPEDKFEILGETDCKNQ